MGPQGSGSAGSFHSAKVKQPIEKTFFSTFTIQIMFCFKFKVTTSSLMIASVGGNSEKENGEWLGEEAEIQESSSRLFQGEHLQCLLNKVIRTLNYQVEVPEKPTSSVSAKVDSRQFKRPVRVQTTSPFTFFENVIKAEWSLLDNGSSVISIAKKFCMLPEDAMEDLKCPLVDALMVALHPGAVLLKDRRMH